ncbi:hypothetical protein BDZ89DRAFT_1131454 [Hymenopellis radicata]|nr:hypothetical protein BDZ89DRAFT_1131454 [Hymenopellis radicata]
MRGVPFDPLTLHLPSTTTDVQLSNLVCCMCQEGGELIGCDICPRAYCYQRASTHSEAPKGCITVHCDLDLMAATFKCAHCHVSQYYRDEAAFRSSLKGEKRPKPKQEPWRGLTIDGKNYATTIANGTTTWTSFAPSDSSGLVIINFRLVTIRVEGGPADAAYNRLYTFFMKSMDPRNALVFCDVPFNLSGTQHQWRPLQELYPVLDRSCSPSASSSFTRIIVFIHTHSTPDLGDLHGAPSHGDSPPRAYAIDQFLPFLFAPQSEIAQALSAADATLVLACCGGPWLISESRKALESFYCQNLFKVIIGFERDKLHPTFTINFLNEVLEQHYILGHSYERSIANALTEDKRIALHSVICVLLNKEHHRYVYHLPTKIQLGVPVPLGCPECHTLKSWQLVSKKEEQEVICSFCDWLYLSGCKATRGEKGELVVWCPDQRKFIPRPPTKVCSRFKFVGTIGNGKYFRETITISQS